MMVAWALSRPPADRPARPRRVGGLADGRVWIARRAPGRLGLVEAEEVGVLGPRGVEGAEAGVLVAEGAGVAERGLVPVLARVPPPRGAG